MDLQREIFGECLILKNSDFPWTPRLPDLTTPDFFLWGYLKDKVYVNKPETRRQMKENIRDEILSLQPEILCGVMENAY
ncbi:uncharacterized protein TNCT_635551 [Trichonephila clavata]|uniref:Uncharacterized protein n=1 Tax=Trichonephila clavata TaxID=2740835 RepID=A0A8X6KWD2_TRICU|nr:uncharacterized protein TNCT_635551 [Trichonephila clavata]